MGPCSPPWLTQHMGASLTRDTGPSRGGLSRRTYFDGWWVFSEDLHCPRHAGGQIAGGREEQWGREAADGDQHLHLQTGAVLTGYPTRSVAHCSPGSVFLLQATEPAWPSWHAAPPNSIGPRGATATVSHSLQVACGGAGPGIGPILDQQPAASPGLLSCLPPRAHRPHSPGTCWDTLRSRDLQWHLESTKRRGTRGV